MPTSSASDSSDRPPSSDSRSSAPLCPECGARLSAGACPACALGLLLGGGPDPEDVPGEGSRVEENVEFGRYTLKQRLAAGGMGVVYVAEDGKLKRTVALKMIRGSTFADDGEVARFTLEAEAAAALDHPNIVPIYEVGRMDGQPFFTMKLIEGATLAQRMKEHGGVLPAREVARLLSLVARAVHHAHQRGVLHRDLKPGNILVDGEGQPWLTDFGLAKLAAADSSLTLTRDHIGTPHYMAPEVAGGNARAVSTASDVWALGVMLWEMLCGVPPFHGPGPVEIMRRILESEPAWPAGSRADGDLVTIARRCMEKNPARRPQSAAEVAEELDRWLRGEPIKARPVTRRERFVKWVRREPAMAALYAVLFLAMMTGLLLWNRAEHAVVSLRETNERMEESLRIATATKLAGDARLQVEENPSRALLLAVESVEMMEPSGVLPESASALTDVLQRTGGLDATAGGLLGYYSEAWIQTSQALHEAAQCSPDSRWLVTVDGSDVPGKGLVAAVFDLHERVQGAPLRRWILSPPQADYPVMSWRWLRDSRRLLVVNDAGRVLCYEAVSEGMTSGRAEPAAPLPVEYGSLEQEGLELYQVKLSAGAPGGAPAGLALYRRKRGDELYDCFYSRCDFAQNGVQAGPVTKLGFASKEYAVADWLPDTRRAVFRFWQDQHPAALVDFDRPGDGPVLLTGMDRAFAGNVSPDGRHLVAREFDSTLWRFDLPAAGGSAREVAGVRLPGGLEGSHEAFEFSPDGQWLAVGGTSGTVTLFPLKTGGPPLSLHSGGRTLTLAFSADSQWLAAGSVQRTVQIWKMADVQKNIAPVVLRGCPTYVAGLSFSEDGKNVVATGGGWAARRWPFDGLSGNAQPLHFQAGAGIVADIAVSPDEAWIAAACKGSAVAGVQSTEGYVTLSRVDGRSTTILATHANVACAVAFSRKGNWLVSTGHDNTVKVWDFAALTASIDSGRGPVEPKFTLPIVARPWNRYSVTFHPGDGCLYQVNCDGILYAWDLSFADPDANHQEERIHSKAYLLPDAVVSPDGHWLAVARHAWDKETPGSPQYGNQVLLFDVGTYSWPPKFVTALQAGFLQETNLAFSPDSRWLAAGGDGSGASVWDLQAADITASRRVSPTSAQSTQAVGFSPDGRWLACGGNDGRLHLWNWQRPEDLRVIQTGTPINTLAWLNDGRLATAGDSNRIMLWDTSVPRLKALARGVAGRTLADGERSRFRIQRK